MRRWAAGFLRSLRYASEGITYALSTQPNMQIHFVIAFIVMIFCLVLDVSRSEIILVFFAIVLVIAAELVNTAIESIVDMITYDYHPLAKIAKDTAAAAVLLVALHAIIVGLLVFHDKLWPLRIHTGPFFTPERFFAALAPIVLLYFWVRTFIFKDRGVGKMNKQQLLEKAKQARETAYVPYSNFPVGAALLTDDGQVVTGCNIENASFGLTNCAERTAIFKLISGGKKDISMIAVVADTPGPVSPCGACRQVMAEFCGPDTKVYLGNLKGDLLETTVSGLLPFSFTKEDMHADNEE